MRNDCGKARYFLMGRCLPGRRNRALVFSTSYAICGYAKVFNRFLSMSPTCGSLLREFKSIDQTDQQVRMCNNIRHLIFDAISPSKCDSDANFLNFKIINNLDEESSGSLVHG